MGSVEDFYDIVKVDTLPLVRSKRNPFAEARTFSGYQHHMRQFNLLPECLRHIVPNE